MGHCGYVPNAIRIRLFVSVSIRTIKVEFGNVVKAAAMSGCGMNEDSSLVLDLPPPQRDNEEALCEQSTTSQPH